MADFPCDFHLARYKGPSHRIYLNVYRDEQSAKFKASVCEPCLEAWLSEVYSRLIVATPEGGWDPQEEGATLGAAWMDAEPSPRPLRRRSA